MHVRPSGKISLALTTLLAVAFVSPSLWQSKASAEGKKEFKGATVQGDKLVLKPGFKLRQVSPTRVETFKEPAETAPTGTPTARRATRPVAVDGIEIKCLCADSGKCTINVVLDSAFCSSSGCKSSCSMVASQTN
jgi:hypothetical protein